MDLGLIKSEKIKKIEILFDVFRLKYVYNQNKFNLIKFENIFNFNFYFTIVFRLIFSNYHLSYQFIF